MNKPIINKAIINIVLENSRFNQIKPKIFEIYNNLPSFGLNIQ